MTSAYTLRSLLMVPTVVFHEPFKLFSSRRSHGVIKRRRGGRESNPSKSLFPPPPLYRHERFQTVKNNKTHCIVSRRSSRVCIADVYALNPII